jgi:hypothetical protein
VKGDGAPLDIDVIVEVQAGFKPPTPLMDGDLKRDVQHVFNGRHLDPLNLSPDESYVLGTEGLLSLGAMFADTEPDARVGIHDAPIHCLLHKDAKDVDFVEGGVVRGNPAPGRWGQVGAPRNVVKTVLPRKGLWTPYFPFMEEQAQRFPAVKVKARRARTVAIAQLDPLRDPAPATTLPLAPDAPTQLVGGSLGLKGTGLPDFDGYVVPQAGANVAPFTLPVSEGNPDERASVVSIRHINAAPCKLGGGSQ